jgi:hypothetical protein
MYASNLLQACMYSLINLDIFVLGWRVLFAPKRWSINVLVILWW